MALLEPIINISKIEIANKADNKYLNSFLLVLNRRYMDKGILLIIELEAMF